MTAVAPRSARTPKPTARLRVADPRHRVLQRPAPVPRDEQPGALLLGRPPRLATVGFVGRSLAGPGRAAVRPGGRGRVGRRAPGGCAGRRSAGGRGIRRRGGRSRRRPSGRPAEPPTRRTRCSATGPKCASASWGSSCAAEVVRVQPKQHDAGDAEASPPLGGRPPDPASTIGNWRAGGCSSERPRPDEEPVLPLPPSPGASGAAAPAPSSTARRERPRRRSRRPGGWRHPRATASRAERRRGVRCARRVARPRVAPAAGRAGRRPGGAAPSGRRPPGAVPSRGRTRSRTATWSARAGSGGARPRPGRSRTSSGTAARRAPRAAR